MYPELWRYPWFAYDTETTGLKWSGSDRLFSFSISLPDGQDFYWDIRETPKAVAWLKSTIQKVRRSRTKIVCHHGAFDYHMTRVTTGIILPLDQMEDTVIRECLIDEHHFSYELDHLAKLVYGIGEKIDVVEQLRGLYQQGGKRMSRERLIAMLPHAPSAVVGPYAKQDTRLTATIYEMQEKEIVAQDLRRILDFEMNLFPGFRSNEEHGIRVDLDAAVVAQTRLSEEIEKLQFELDKIAGFNVNVNSNNGKENHMHRVFAPRYVGGRWEANNGESLGETPGGRASLAAETLQGLRHPAAPYIVDIRALLKLRDTFIGGHVLAHAHNGRVHPNINQTKGPDGGTGTGRLSYTDPALQQIPKRNKQISSVIRPIFLPDEGHRWVDSDLASFEVRVFAHLVNNDTLSAKYRANPYLDLHSYVSELAGIPRDKPPEGGANGKQLNLSMIFNQGKGATAEEMGLPWAWDTFTTKTGQTVTYKKPGEEAERRIEQYHENMPGVRDLAKRAKELAQETGYVFTKYGRRLRFPYGGRYAYKASGLLIQATAADWNKENWELINDALDGRGKLLLNTHDSYSLSIEEGRVEITARDIKGAIENYDRSRIPLILEIQPPGDNWWDSYSKECWIK